MNKTDNLLTWINNTDLDTSETAERKLLKASRRARRNADCRWHRMADIRRSILNARIAREYRLGGSVQMALDYESLSEFYALNAFADFPRSARLDD